MKIIKEFIKSHEQLYKLIRPIELKYYAFQRWLLAHETIRRGRRIVCICIKPGIRKITGRKETRDLIDFHNIHKGRRIFVIAPGPSLREEDVLKLKDEITISVNGTVTLTDTIGWRPTYYCIGDIGGYLKFKDQINNAGYKDVFMDIEVFKKYEKDFPFTPHYYDNYMSFKDLLASMRGKVCTEVSDDMYLKGAHIGGRSIATIALQLAVYMGASEIYLLGQDCDYSGSKHYFDNRVNEHFAANPAVQDSFTQAMFAFYRTARKYCEEHNIKLYNATRGGRLEELERIDFDKIFE